MPKRSRRSSATSNPGSVASLRVLPLSKGGTPGTETITVWGKGHNYYSQLGHPDHTAHHHGGLHGGTTPLIQAVLNPFSRDALIRIPDSVANSFCLAHTGTCVTQMPSQASTPNVTLLCGFALRPSAADGSGVYNSPANAAGAVGGTSIPITPDAWLPMGMATDNTGNYRTKGVWYQSLITPQAAGTGTGQTPLVTYLWGSPQGTPRFCEYNGASRALANFISAPTWITAITGFLQSFGTKMRPVVWAIWVQSEGLADTSTGQVIMPAGRFYYGLRNTADNTGESFGAEAQPGNAFNVLKESVDFQTFYDLNGPTSTQAQPCYAGSGAYPGTGGREWDEPSVNNNISTQLIGSMSAVQFEELPCGFIISASFTGPDDIVWRDIAYWTGQNRFYDAVNFVQNAVTANYTIIPHNYFDMVGIQPFIWYEGCINMKIRWRFTISWECQPGQQGYVLPGRAIGRAVSDRGQFEDFTDFMAEYQAGVQAIEPLPSAIALHNVMSRSSAM